MLRGETSCVWGQRSSTSTEDPCHAGSSPAGSAPPSLETLSSSFASSGSSPPLSSAYVFYAYLASKAILQSRIDGLDGPSKP